MEKQSNTKSMDIEAIPKISAFENLRYIVSSKDHDFSPTTETLRFTETLLKHFGTVRSGKLWK